MTLRLLWPDVLSAPDLDDVEVVTYDVGAPLPESVADADVYVVWARSADLFAADARLLRTVRLVQALMAGAEALEAAGFHDGAVICSGVGLHDRTVAEHTLGLVLALVRRLPGALESQARHEWFTDMAGFRPLHHEGPITTLIDAEVLIWGFGSIAATLAPMLTALGAHVRGVARSAGERHGYDVITPDDLGDALPGTDVLISILPGGEETADVLDAGRFARLPDHAFVVNVGRGSVLDEEALVAALRDGTLGGAALDVTKTEPLPADSPLWDAPNIILTPHCAGARPVGYPELVRENLAALAEGRRLRNQI